MSYASPRPAVRSGGSGRFARYYGLSDSSGPAVAMTSKGNASATATSARANASIMTISPGCGEASAHPNGDIMPGHSLGRRDGHHEMVDFRGGKVAFSAPPACYHFATQFLGTRWNGLVRRVRRGAS